MFSLKLKELRERANLSQYAFARKFGVAQSTVGGWESGAREPNFETVKKLAAFFKVSTDYLLDVPEPLVPELKKGVPEMGTPEWLRSMFQKLGVDVNELTDAQVEILIKNTDSLAKMFREELLKKQ